MLSEKEHRRSEMRPSDSPLVRMLVVGVNVERLMAGAEGIMKRYHCWDTGSSPVSV